MPFASLRGTSNAVMLRTNGCMTVEIDTFKEWAFESGQGVIPDGQNTVAVCDTFVPGVKFNGTVIVWGGALTTKLAVEVWVPVATVTVTGPVVAFAEICNCAVADVGLLTVSTPNCPGNAPATEIPEPKLASVEPWTKLV